MSDAKTATGSKHAFVSYSSADRQRVRGLGLLVKALGYRVFLDEQSLLPGMKWQPRLRNALDDADLLIVFWCRYANTSDWVRREKEIRLRQAQSPPEYVAVATRCLRRLNKKGNRLLLAGKHPNKVKVACAREMVGFVWESLRMAAA